MTEFLTIVEAAQKVGASKSLLQARCKDGSLPAIRVGRSYRIKESDLEAWVKHSPTPRQATHNLSKADSDLHSDLEGWLMYLRGVKALSDHTVRTHRGHLRCYLKRMATGEEILTLRSMFRRQTLLSVFGAIPVKSYAVKYNTYNALLSFGQYLVEEGRLDADSLAAVRALKPRRQVDPRRTHLRAQDVPRLFDVILTRPRPMVENLAFAAMVGCMVYAGLRVGEVCNLRYVDLDLGNRVLLVRHGKGGKDRRVGISQALFDYLKRFAQVRNLSEYLFCQPNHQPWNPHMLAKRMRRIAVLINRDITCHGLRRTFATLAANQGRSVNSIRIALGHANLETTQAYLRTSEQEVVEAMKGW